MAGSREAEKLEIPTGTYAALAAQPSYRARKEADKVSYTWDRLLDLFTDSILKGEAEGAAGQEPDPSEMEKGMRSMALEPRLRRRLLGRSVADAIKSAEDKKADRFARNIAPGAHGADEKVGYVFLMLAHRGDAPGPTYDDYRKRRRLMLRGYCLSMLQGNRNLKRAVGIGIDASSKVTGRNGGSEDLYALEVDSWTSEFDKQTEELKKELGSLKPENVTRRPPASMNPARRGKRAVCSQERGHNHRPRSRVAEYVARASAERPTERHGKFYPSEGRGQVAFAPG
jgi:hypothetical protein